jgi:Domain of unknown function (DUF4279)
MAEIEGATASFRLFSDTLDPQVVSERLGLAPSTAGAKGEPRPTRRKSPPLQWRTGTWILESPLPRSAKLEAHVRDVLDRLEDRTGEIRAFMAQEYRADVFCGCFLDASNEGTTLEPETLRLLALIGVPLGLDIYCLSEPARNE